MYHRIGSEFPFTTGNRPRSSRSTATKASVLVKSTAPTHLDISRLLCQGCIRRRHVIQRNVSKPPSCSYGLGNRATNFWPTSVPAAVQDTQFVRVSTCERENRRLLWSRAEENRKSVGNIRERHVPLPSSFSTTNRAFPIVQCRQRERGQLWQSLCQPSYHYRLGRSDMEHLGRCRRIRIDWRTVSESVTKSRRFDMEIGTFFLVLLAKPRWQEAPLLVNRSNQRSRHGLIRILARDNLVRKKTLSPANTTARSWHRPLNGRD